MARRPLRSLDREFWGGLAQPPFNGQPDCKNTVFYDFSKGSRQKISAYFTVRLTVRVNPRPPAPYSQFFVFFVFFFILDYDSMCSEMDFTLEKSFSSNYKNSQLLLTAAAALSQNDQITV